MERLLRFWRRCRKREREIFSVISCLDDTLTSLLLYSVHEKEVDKQIQIFVTQHLSVLRHYLIDSFIQSIFV